MPTSSLLELCRRQAGRMIHRIDDLGQMSYHIAKPILLKVHNAEQLHRIEENSPQFIGETREIWLDLIKRDIPGWQDKLVEPANPAKWYKVYRKLIKESDKEVDEDALILQAALKNLEEEKLKRTSKVVDAKSVPKIPRYGVPPRSRLGNKVPEKPSDLRFTSGSKTKMVTGRGVIERAKREARERMHFSSKNAVLAKPTHMLNSKATTIRQAPQGLIEEHRRPLDSAPTGTGQVKVIAPRKPSAANSKNVVKDPSAPRKYTREEREARLKAISSGKPLPAPPISSSTASSSKPKFSAAASSSRPRPPASSQTSTSSLTSQKRKKEEEARDSKVDDLFDDHLEDAPLAGTAGPLKSDLKGRETDPPRKPAPTPTDPPLAKKLKSGSPLMSGLTDKRPRAVVRKAEVNVFIKKPRRPVR